MKAEMCSTLLAADDPSPVQVVRGNGAAPVLLLCEHAGQRIPAALGNLGLSNDILGSHRGWDIGAEAVARQLSERLDAPLIVQRYSRLVIDCNRPPNTPESIPTVSDGITIPGNNELSDQDKKLRESEIFLQFDQAINRQFDQFEYKAVFSIHSFTPSINGHDRPWHAGFLSRTAPEVAAMLISEISATKPELVLAQDEPYQISDETDWFIPMHAERRGLPNCLVEIRNDQIDDPDRATQWANLLGNAINKIVETNQCS